MTRDIVSTYDTYCRSVKSVEFSVRISVVCIGIHIFASNGNSILHVTPTIGRREKGEACSCSFSHIFVQDS
jgi:hypothetical protein